VDAIAVLAEGFSRIPELVRDAVADLDADQLAAMPPGIPSDATHDGVGNSVGWLVWHLTRVQDAQIADVAGHSQLWVSDGWAERFGMAPDPGDHGYGHTREQVAAVRPESGELLVEYLDAVHARTMEYLGGLGDDDLDRVVDDNWDPPVTLGVRLVSVVDDDAQHAGQAAYVRGLLLGG
jgi:uncharacterized damage-inducible protein DinB